MSLEEIILAYMGENQATNAAALSLMGEAA